MSRKSQKKAAAVATTEKTATIAELVKVASPSNVPATIAGGASKEAMRAAAMVKDAIDQGKVITGPTKVAQGADMQGRAATPAERVLRVTALDMLTTVRKSGVERLWLKLIEPVCMFVKEQEKAGNTQYNANTVRQHIFELIGYGQEDSARERERNKSQTFEQQATTGIRAGLLAARGFGGTAVRQDKEGNVIDLVAPGATLVPEFAMLDGDGKPVKTVDPKTGKTVTQMQPNTDTEHRSFTVRQITDLYSKAFPGAVRNRKPRAAEGSQQAADSGQSAIKMGMTDLANELTHRLEKFNEDGKFPAADVLASLEECYEALDQLFTRVKDRKAA